MAQPPFPSGTTPEPRHDPSEVGPPGLPRWLKVSGLVVVVLVALVLVVMLITGGDHGPGRHASALLGGAQAGAESHATNVSPGGRGGSSGRAHW